MRCSKSLSMWHMASDISKCSGCKPFGIDHSKGCNKVDTNSKCFPLVLVLACGIPSRNLNQVLIPMDPPTILGLKLGHQHSPKPWSPQVRHTWTHCMLFLFMWGINDGVAGWSCKAFLMTTCKYSRLGISASSTRWNLPTTLSSSACAFAITLWTLYALCHCPPHDIGSCICVSCKSILIAKRVWMLQLIVASPHGIVWLMTIIFTHSIQCCTFSHYF